MLWVNWDFEEAIFARWLAGSRGSANWGRLGQVASGERSLKGVRTEKEQEQMSACQLPQLLLRSFDYPAPDANLPPPSSLANVLFSAPRTL